MSIKIPLIKIFTRENYMFWLYHSVVCLYHCVVYSADVGRILYINGYYFIFLAYTNVCLVTELT